MSRASSHFISLKGRAVEVRHPSDWDDDLKLLFGPTASSSAAICSQLEIVCGGDGLFSVREADVCQEGLSRQSVLRHITSTVVGRLAEQIDAGPSLHAGVVAWHGRSILIPGDSGAGKTSLTAWLVDRGFDFLTDELAVVVAGSTALAGLPRALMLKPGADAIVSSWPRFAGCAKRQADSVLMIRPETTVMVQDAELPCGLIVFPAFASGASLSIELLSAAKASMRLMTGTGNSHLLVDGGFATISRLARNVPAVVLTYGAFEQLDGVADTLAKLVLEQGLDSGQVRRMAAALSGSAGASQTKQQQRHPIPAPTPRRSEVKLTIGMATYDDYDGVYFSLQALRLYHPEIVDQAEFIVVDNHPDGICAESLKALEKSIPNYRYIPETARSGTSVRERVFEEAAGEIVLCMDCHVFVVPGAVQRLLNYFAENPKTPDLLQGPLLRDDMTTLWTHWRPEWRGGMYGAWDDSGLAADPGAPPFDIPMQGMGLFACRRAAWLGFNKAFRGFGGEEGYIHEKFRRAGARTLCLPFLRWMHRFDRPMGVPFRNTWEDRIWNYLVGFEEVGLPTDQIERHFRDQLGEEAGSKLIEAANLAIRERRPLGPAPGIS